MMDKFDYCILVGRTVEALRMAELAGTKVEYLRFYGSHAASLGSRHAVGPNVLSQWWPSQFSDEGVVYRSAEHCMMAKKALLFGDRASFEAIIRSPSPRAAKELGRQVRGFDEECWIRHRYSIVVEGNLAKFSSSQELSGYLIGTGSKVLVECSPTDRVWGIGLSIAEENVERPSKWRGQNLLGFALMDVRERLMASRSGSR